MKKTIVPLFIAGVLAIAVAAPAFQKAPAQPTKVFIPKEVKEPMTAGMAAKTPRLDIPFEVFRTQFLPAQQAFYQIFFLKIKNADLGFAPSVGGDVVDPTAPVIPKMKAVVNLFLQFHQVENGLPGKLVKEIYVPAALEVDQTGFDAEKTDWYTIGYPLMPGDYLASIAVCSQDLSKVGIQYVEFKLPDPNSFTSTIDTTPLFFMTEYKQVQAPEQKAELHKGFFAYSVIQVTPSLDNVFTVGQPLDLFTYIFGCQPKSGSTYDIEVIFEVVEGDKPAIKFAPGNFDSPLVSLPLNLKQTLQIKQGENVRQEVRDLPAGSYTFVMKIKDKVSGNTGEKRIDFSVK